MPMTHISMTLMSDKRANTGSSPSHSIEARQNSPVLTFIGIMSWTTSSLDAMMSKNLQWLFKQSPRSEHIYRLKKLSSLPSFECTTNSSLCKYHLQNVLHSYISAITSATFSATLRVPQILFCNNFLYIINISIYYYQSYSSFISIHSMIYSRYMIHFNK